MTKLKLTATTTLRIIWFLLVLVAVYAAISYAVTPAVGSDQSLTVDGEVYSATKISGPTVHYETPDTSPEVAFTERNTWTGNGSEWLPCEGGIHWIDNENVLTISNCLEVPTTTTTIPTTTSTSPTTSTTTTTVPVTTTVTTPTTTTTPPTTTSTVPPSTSTTPPTVPTTELPFTGIHDFEPIAVYGVLALLAGLVLLTLTSTKRN